MDEKLNAGLERVRIHLSARAAGVTAGSAAKASQPAQSATARNGWSDELAKATCEVFDIMVGVPVECANEGSSRFISDFAAMVGIAGSVCGLVGLHTNSGCARKIAAKMLGSEEAASEEAQDAFGEVCNMIAGSFKARIAGLADGCALSVPTVIFGRDFTLFSLAHGQHFELNYTFEGCPLSVTLDVHG